jgi:aminopeptidase N
MKNLIAFLLLLSSMLSFGQQTEKLDVLEINASIKIDTLDFKVNGHVQVKFKVLQNIDSIYLDGVNMTITPTENSPYKIVEKDNKV